MLQLTFEEKYDAIGRQESLYEGLFVTAVKTTGIFCRPSCRARKPKAENVVFYNTAQEALAHGYRPCKICRPMEPEAATPDYIRFLIKELERDPYTKIKDCDLRQKGLEPSRVRRWFKSHHNMTFHAYQRMLRINAAFKQIQNGDAISRSAFDSGYGSLSGFNESYRSVFGASPKASKGKEVINIVRFSTKLGAMFACATQQGVCLLEFAERRMLETEFQDLSKRLNAVILPGQNELLTRVQDEVYAYLAGELRQFTVPLHTPGTEFQQSVWRLLREIPYGQTWSYAEEAERLGKPKAVRAVANANGQNRVAIIIPCHRVIGSDGSLTGYGGGLPRKQYLLDLEKQVIGSLPPR